MGIGVVEIGFSTQGEQCVLEDRGDGFDLFAGALGRSREGDDQGILGSAGYASAQVRQFGDLRRLGSGKFEQARMRAVDDLHRCFGCSISGSQSCAAGGEDEVDGGRGVDPLAKLLSDLIFFIRQARLIDHFAFEDLSDKLGEGWS